MMSTYKSHVEGSLCEQVLVFTLETLDKGFLLEQSATYPNQLLCLETNDMSAVLLGQTGSTL